jgi:hypothetical protein
VVSTMPIKPCSFIEYFLRNLVGSGGLQSTRISREFHRMNAREMASEVGRCCGGEDLATIRNATASGCGIHHRKETEEDSWASCERSGATRNFAPNGAVGNQRRRARAWVLRTGAAR